MDAVTTERRKVRTEKGLSNFFGLVSWSDRRNNFFWLEIIVAIALIGIGATTAWILLGQAPDSNPIDPIWAAVLLVSNLIPATAMLVLIGRRLALRRMQTTSAPARQMLHVRLVALFSLLAAVPTLFLVIFASYLFQSGVQFWFSGSARGIMENAGALAEGYYQENRENVKEETALMAKDLQYALSQTKADTPLFWNAYANQVILRKLSESAIVQIQPDGTHQTIAYVSADDQPKQVWFDNALLTNLQSDGQPVVSVIDEKIVSVTVLFNNPRTYLFANRAPTVPSFKLNTQAKKVLSDYKTMVTRSKRLQFRFNVALYVISLMINMIAVWVALKVADRLVRPVNSLVDAAQKIAEGDLSARVEEDVSRMDEVALLSRSFNSMTQRLEEQTGALLVSNQQLQDRGSFIEAVLGSVSAGVISIDEAGNIQLANATAELLLSGEGQGLIGSSLKSVAPHFAELLEEQVESRVIQIEASPDPQTLAVRISRTDSGAVITFEDISQQLADQRRAAWSDVARRIAHEIKNPLTPIQLAAERLQRRFSTRLKAQSEDAEIFGQLTGTIVRQVEDLRKIADEFSSFARMPKPVMREENLSDVVAHSVFLFEVANPAIDFSFEDGGKPVSMVCDRRQIGQAVTNLLKNSVEAIRENSALETTGKVATRIASYPERLVVEVSDNGTGLPPDRNRMVEPYVTKKKSGSGLGLAIVKRIVDEHHGQLELDDNPGGGAIIRMVFDPQSAARSKNAATIPFAQPPAAEK